MDTPLGRLINFLVEWTKNVVEPLVGGRIFNRFAELDGAGLSHIYYYIRFHEHIAPNIAKWDNFNVTTRIRMMFALSGEVPDDFLALIKLTGTVQLDAKRRISKYASNDGNLKLEGCHGCTARSKNERGKDPAEITRFMNFLVEKAKVSTDPMFASVVFTEFRKSEEDGLAYSTYCRKFYNYLAPRMDQFVNYSIEERVRLMFGLGGEVTEDFLKLCRKEGVVELDKNNRICEYISYDGTLKLGAAHGLSANMKRRSLLIAKDPSDLPRLMNFLVEKTKDATEPMVSIAELSEFRRRERSELTEQAYYGKFHRQLAPKMGQIVNYSIEERVRVMFGFAGEVTDDFLKQIQTIGTVHLDEKKRICKYATHDGKLKLEGDHSHTARMLRRGAYYRRLKTGRKSISKFSGMEHSRSPKRARISERDDDDEYFGVVNEGESHNRDVSHHNLNIDYLQANNQPIPEDLPYEIDDDEMEHVGAVNYDPEHRHFDFDDSHIGHLQNDEEMMNNQSIPEDPSYKSDEVEYNGSLPGLPKPEPIDFDFYQIYNRDVSHSLNLNNLRENKEVSWNPSISEIKVDFTFFERQQFSVPTNNGATSAESKIISLHDFLKSLIQFICFLESSELTEIKQKIKESIRTDNDKFLQITDICTVLQAFFFGISRKFRLAAAASNSPAMKMKDFLVKFKLFLLGLDSSELLELQQKVQENIDEQTELAEKVLPISDVRQSLQNLLSTISQY
eukprot:NP_496587.1 Uncharacterized protein CELE_Y57A10A.7 [Caenorhabditis elegans]